MEEKEDAKEGTTKGRERENGEKDQEGHQLQM